MRKALFLDRDGIINKELGKYISTWDDFEFNYGIFETTAFAKEKGFLVIVITNQAGVAKGIFTEEELLKIHGRMVEEFKIRGVEIDAVYYCPHHPDYSDCLCRKPGTLLFERAIKDFNIDVTKSLMIGDRDRDIEAAAKVGVKGILIPSNSSLKFAENLLK